MASKNTWLVVPAHSFADASAWQSPAPDTYGALRLLVLVRESRGAKARYGVALEKYTVAPNDKIELEQSHERVVSAEETISAGVKFSVLSKLGATLASKASAQFGSDSAVLPIKLGHELQASTTVELARSIERTLEATSSFKIEATDRTRHTITLTGGTEPREALMRRQYWPHYWDIYVHSWEYLEITYKRNWSIYKIRQTVRRVPQQVLGWPVCRLTFFEPQTNLDVTYGAIADELETPEAVLVSSLDGEMPAVQPPPLPDLQREAGSAFPGTPEERAATRKVAAKKPAAKKAVAKKAAARKPAAKKAAARKPAAKKAAARKPAAKKAAPKEPAAKRPAAKKAAAKKPAAKRAA